MSGLDGVVVADTVCSRVDGLAGILVIRGFAVEDLAGRFRFEEVVDLLHRGALPDDRGEARRAAMAKGRLAAWELVPRLDLALSLPDGMDALRASLASLDGKTDPDGIIGAVAVFAAAWDRRRRGLPPLPPRESAWQAEDVLRMVTGDADPARVAGLDAYWAAVVDHGMNASTFAARVVTSTGSDAVSAVVAGVGALKGPLHGGAPGPVLDMLDAIGSPAEAGAWISDELDAGRRIMGMGHRIYRVRDPRAAVLERAVAVLEAQIGATGRLPVARAVEREAERILAERHPDRPLKANVEFYTAVLLDAVGISRELFTPMFAVGRAAGWLAHVDEQRRTGRLIRPESRYVGP